jgi:hypothetical protein
MRIFERRRRGTLPFRMFWIEGVCRAYGAQMVIGLTPSPSGLG